MNPYFVACKFHSFIQLSFCSPIKNTSHLIYTLDYPFRFMVNSIWFSIFTTDILCELVALNKRIVFPTFTNIVCTINSHKFSFVTALLFVSVFELTLKFKVVPSMEIIVLLFDSLLKVETIIIFQSCAFWKPSAPVSPFKTTVNILRSQLQYERHLIDLMAQF